MGTPTCDPVDPTNIMDDGSVVLEGGDLALVSASREVVSTKINTEAASQQLMDNLLGMHLPISRKVNGLIKYFIFFRMDCIHPLQGLPFQNIATLQPFSNSSLTPFPSIAECTLSPDLPHGSPISWTSEEFSYDGSEESNILL